MSGTHVCIVTPTYDNKITTEYLNSFIDHHMNRGIDVSYFFSNGDSLITRSRNYCITHYYNNMVNHEYTHLFWNDADVALCTTGSLKKLVDRNVDVVAVPVPLKRNVSDQGLPQSCFGPYEEVDKFFYKVQYAATGALMLSNKAVSAIINDCKKNNAFWNDAGSIVYDAFRIGVSENKVYLSEDWFLCATLKRLGFDIYADSSIAVKHIDSARAFWYRPECSLSENVLYEKTNIALPEELLYDRWCGSEFFSK